ncbi:MAG: hypothetical protein WC716_14325 [Chitinophagaceae bacterium]|jgi:hypothetical protein
MHKIQVARVHFEHDSEDGQESVQEIYFMRMPRIGESIFYSSNQGIGTYYMVKKIVHTVDVSFNESQEQIDMYVSPEGITV